jgi:hypothetical protein
MPVLASAPLAIGARDAVKNRLSRRKRACSSLGPDQGRSVFIDFQSITAGHIIRAQRYR